ncbi:MAG: biopolymer transporter ExbD [Burkholderiaceae bacterium]|nr:biopolymer transporter ExbD [Burkholderiaceae bacterium]
MAWSARPGRRRRMMADINVVPYIDVMLVLVVILMAAGARLRETQPGRPAYGGPRLGQHQHILGSGSPFVPMGGQLQA